MREILFRGKRIDNGEWVEGFLIGLYDPMIKEDTIKHAFIKDGTIFDREHKVAPETVGQYTGLTDKNGKKIFEGDIGKVNEDIYVCFWNECNYEFGFTNSKRDFGIAYAQDIEVIGNIHDKSRTFERSRIMARYYEAEALIQFVKQYSPHINGETTLECVERAIRNAPTEDVVPRSEVEDLQREYDSLAKTDISSTELIRKLKGKAEKANQEVEKADKEIERLTKILENYALQYGTVTDKQKVIDQAKQEVAREIFDKFECHISTGIRILKDCINDTDAEQVKRHLLGRLHELCGMEKFIAELKKKYIGKDTDVPTNKGE